MASERGLGGRVEGESGGRNGREYMGEGVDCGVWGQHFGSAIGCRSGRGWPVRVVRAGDGCLREFSLLAESASIRDSVCFLGLF